MLQSSTSIPVILFIMLYKVVLTFDSVDEILKCDHSNGIYQAVLSYGSVLYYAVLILEMKSLSVHDNSPIFFSSSSPLRNL